MSGKHPKQIMMVAGEQSGDMLGAGLIQQLKVRYPNCEFVGIGGERMQAAGLHSYYPLDRLSVMGFIEPLKRLPELLGILSNLKKRMQQQSPDIFIGIDSPDFNLKLEKAAKHLGILSVHYVSPSVWAWRQGRIKNIKKCVDLMLTILPFEAEFYRQHEVEVCFVGHPLADEFSMDPDSVGARLELGLDASAKICALMPGSRQSEIRFLLPLMLDSAKILREEFPELTFVLPAANSERRKEIDAVFEDESIDYIHVIDGQSHAAMRAANFVIMASGTTTLEAMLLKRPMVITYKWPWLTWQLLSRLVCVPWVGLPNLLAGEEVAPELLQDRATSAQIVEHARPLMTQSERQEKVIRKFYELHTALRQNASQSAAEAIIRKWDC